MDTIRMRTFGNPKRLLHSVFLFLLFCALPGFSLHAASQAAVNAAQARYDAAQNAYLAASERQIKADGDLAGAQNQFYNFHGSKAAVTAAENKLAAAKTAADNAAKAVNDAYNELDRQKKLLSDQQAHEQADAIAKKEQDDKKKKALDDIKTKNDKLWTDQQERQKALAGKIAASNQSTQDSLNNASDTFKNSLSSNTNPPAADPDSDVIVRGGAVIRGPKAADDMTGLLPFYTPPEKKADSDPPPPPANSFSSLMANLAQATVSAATQPASPPTSAPASSDTPEIPADPESMRVAMLGMQKSYQEAKASGDTDTVAAIEEKQKRVTEAADSYTRMLNDMKQDAEQLKDPDLRQKELDKINRMQGIANDISTQAHSINQPLRTYPVSHPDPDPAPAPTTTTSSASYQGGASKSPQPKQTPSADDGNFFSYFLSGLMSLVSNNHIKQTPPPYSSSWNACLGPCTNNVPKK